MRALVGAWQDSSVLNLQLLFPEIPTASNVDPPTGYQLWAFLHQDQCLELIYSGVGDTLRGRASGPRIAFRLHRTATIANIVAAFEVAYLNSVRVTHGGATFRAFRCRYWATKNVPVSMVATFIRDI